MSHRRCNRRTILMLCAWLLALGLAQHSAATVAALPASQLPGAPSCATKPSAIALPSEVALGQVVHVTLSVDIACLVYDLPTRIVLVLDAGAHTAGEPLSGAKEAARAVVDGLRLDEPRARWLRVGVVVVGREAALACPFTSDPAALRACIDAVQAAGSAPLADGLDVAARAARDDPADLGPPEERRDLIVLLSDGALADACESLAAASRAVQRAFGVLVVAACGSERCRTACLQAAASHPRYVLSDPVDLAQLVRQAVHDGCAAAATTSALPNCGIRPPLRVRVQLAEGVALVQGSVWPPLASHDAAFRDLVWEARVDHGHTLTIRYAVRVQDLSARPINDAAGGSWERDPGSDAAIAWRYPAVRVRVVPPGMRHPWPAEQRFLPSAWAR